jgi:hypothetical protein
MPFIRFPTPRLLALATLLLASACTTSGAIHPPVDDLKAAVEAKPLPGDDIATSDQASADYSAALEGWGDRLYSAGGRLCRWNKRTFKLGIACPAPKPGEQP